MSGVTVTDALGRLTEGATGCLGAVFLTYPFNATFFEEEILASVLPLQEDPSEATLRFLQEGRRRLIETPIVVIADAGLLRGGQRLPYDLLRPTSTRLFHPKLALLLYENRARLMVGSGNLTEGGYGGNAELSAALWLDFTRDVALISEIVSFIEACGARGEAWSRFLSELRPRLGPAREGIAGPPWFVHSLDEVPLLDAFLARIPPTAKVERIGVLAPYHQEDDAPPDRAIFDRLIAATNGQRSRSFELDIGVSWEGNSVASNTAPPSSPSAHLGELWGRVDGARGKETTSWFILGKHVDRSFEVDDGRITKRQSIREFNAMCAARTTWPIGPVVAHVAEDLVDRAAELVPVNLWLHPEVHRRDGRVYSQPLHGKLLTIAVRQGKQLRSWVLVGSPNASAAALLRPDGNIECALVLELVGHHHIWELCDRLVPVPRSQVVFRQRSFTSAPPSPARWVIDAVYDAATSILCVTWQPASPPLVLVYPSAPPRTLLNAVPGGTTVFEGFVLDPGRCELEVRDPKAGTTGPVPIRVEHAIQLLVEGQTTELDLSELLRLHGGRDTLAGIASRRAAGGTHSDAEIGLATILGDALTPREVFRALLAIGIELSKATSLGALQVLLSGPWGVRKLAERIVGAPERGELTSIEAWIYAQELARVLEAVCFEDTPTRSEKAALRDEVITWIRGHTVAPDDRLPGLGALRRYYEKMP